MATLLVRARTIAIDFDGVIHKYSRGWQDGSIYDDEIPGCFEAIQQLMGEYSVFVFSTRNCKHIRRWLLPKIMVGDYEHSGPGNDPTEWVSPRYGFTCKIIPRRTEFWNCPNILGITNRKLAAEMYIDDRALKFEGDWKETMSAIAAFTTYQGRRKNSGT